MATGANLAPVGRLILDLLESGDIEAARAWVKKAEGSAEKRPGDPSTPSIQALASWVLDATTDPDMIRPAAASLLGRYSVSEEAIEILTTARSKAKTALDRSQLDVALCEAYASTERWTDVLAVSKRLLDSNLFKSEGLHYALRATQAGGLWTELEDLARARLDANDKDSTGTEAMAMAKSGQGDYTAAAEWLAKIKPQSFQAASHARLAAWLALIAGEATAEHLEKLLPKDIQSATTSEEMQFTLAALYAALDRPEDAMQSFRVAIGATPPTDLDAKAWVIYGKICDLYGLPDEAGHAYERARATPARDDMDWRALALLR